MTIQRDFEELLRLLEQNSVRYMIIGGYAVAFHGYPRFTKDIDIFFLNSAGNIEKLQKALIEFGFPKSTVPQKLFEKKGDIIQFGVVPMRIDLLNKIPGITFEEAEKHVTRGLFGEVEVNFVGKAELIKNKRASGRPQDNVDAGILGKVKKKK
jgi:hypothetical protein